jgi:hypothetical protein
MRGFSNTQSYYNWLHISQKMMETEARSMLSHGLPFANVRIRGRVRNILQLNMPVKLTLGLVGSTGLGLQSSVRYKLTVKPPPLALHFL